MAIELQPITKDNVADVFHLKVTPGQEGFVAPNPWSLAQALAEHDIAWPRAVVVDGRVVGFLMFEVDPDEEDGRPYWLWRLMIDAAHQRQGYGGAALRLALDEHRLGGATEVYTSWMPGDGTPETFYLNLGFEPTGEMDDDEIVARLDLRQT